MSDKHDLHDEHISRLYQLGSKNEPPEHLDQKIKQAALNATSRRKSRLAWPSLASAAVLVLSVSVVLKVLEQEPLDQSMLETLPKEMNDSVQPPIQDRELDEEAITTDKKDLDDTPGADARFSSGKAEEAPIKSEMMDPAPMQAPAMAPALKDATPAMKPEPRPKDAPALEMRRGQPKAPAKDISAEPGALGQAKKQSQPTSVEAEAKSKKRQLQRKRFELKASPESLQKAPAMMDRNQACENIVWPGTDLVSDWLEQYQTAIKNADNTRARCLQLEFQKRFNKPLPLGNDK